MEGGEDFAPMAGPGAAGGTCLPAKEGFSGPGGDIFK
jgi:hypothetical protein